MIKPVTHALANPLSLLRKEATIPRRPFVAGN